MLVRIVDHKQKPFFINPLYIKSVIEKKPGHVEVHGSFTGMTGKILVKDEEAESIADRVSIALTAIGAAGAAAIEDQVSQANAAAAGGGGAAATAG